MFTVRNCYFTLLSPRNKCNLTSFTDHRKTVSSWKKFVKYYQNKLQPKPASPPYTHVCQVGDPVLRRRADCVPEEHIKSEEIQQVLNKMGEVVRKYKAAGLCAPQVGVPLRIILMEFPEEYLKHFPSEVQASRQMISFPRKVFINPEIQVVNPQKVIFTEACESVRGFSASVPRFHEVEISGLNESGDKHKWRIKGWPARIAQHEIDHLEGKMYTDIMEPKTFQYDYWHWVNAYSGRHSQQFSD